MTGVKEDMHMLVCHVLWNLAVGATTLAVILTCIGRILSSLAFAARVFATIHVSIPGSEMIANAARSATLTERPLEASFQLYGMFCHGPILLPWNATTFLAWP